MRRKNSRRNRPPAYIQLVSDLESTASHTLDLLGAELRHDGAPLADGSRADVQRPRDIRGLLEVIDNIALEHAPSLSPLKFELQVRSHKRGLTSVDMEKLNDLADRLFDAMKEARVTASELARECRVTPAAVTKWLNRETQKLSADNYAAAARALGVREEWLRTGKLPRERDADLVQLERVQAALRDLREPLAAVLAAIDELSGAEAPKKRKTGG